MVVPPIIRFRFQPASLASLLFINFQFRFNLVVGSLLSPLDLRNTPSVNVSTYSAQWLQCLLEGGLDVKIDLVSKFDVVGPPRPLCHAGTMTCYNECADEIRK